MIHSIIFIIHLLFFIICHAVDGVLVELEKNVYEVAENVSDIDLALLVCANTSSDVQVEFTVTVSVENGTALGKLVLHYTFQCLG